MVGTRKKIVGLLGVAFDDGADTVERAIAANKLLAGRAIKYFWDKTVLAYSKLKGVVRSDKYSLLPEDDPERKSRTVGRSDPSWYQPNKAWVQEAQKAEEAREAQRLLSEQLLDGVYQAPTFLLEDQNFSQNSQRQEGSGR
jgi:hypothetical protein